MLKKSTILQKGAGLDTHNHGFYFQHISCTHLATMEFITLNFSVFAMA